MFWEYVRIYAYVSLAIGLVATLKVIWSKRQKILYTDSLDSETTARGMRSEIEAGRVQREVYGERVVYYGLDWRGKSTIQALEATNNFKRNNKPTYILLIFFIGIINMTITWPARLIIWARNTLPR